MGSLSAIHPAIMLVAALVSTGCGPAQDAGKPAAGASAQARATLSKPGTSQAKTDSTAPRNRRAAVDSGPPFERMAGYVVRGTDESSFRRCGSKRIHYIRAFGEAAAHLSQRYRFNVSAPLAPVYFVFRARVLDDTVSIGDHTYTSVVEVRSVYPEEQGTPECAAPMRGSMIGVR
jgi:hypothetical protein